MKFLLATLEALYALLIAIVSHTRACRTINLFLALVLVVEERDLAIKYVFIINLNSRANT